MCLFVGLFGNGKGDWVLAYLPFLFLGGAFTFVGNGMAGS